MNEIQEFLKDKKEVKRIIQLTKKTDGFYLSKRNITIKYNPLGHYAFESFKYCFNREIKNIYENMHLELLYTDVKQNFEIAINTFEKISNIFKDIDE